jgi:hypothetical protein
MICTVSADNKCRTFYLQELFLLEDGKQSSHRLSGGPDHLGDFFVREGERQLQLASSFLMACAEIQQEAGQLFTRRVRKPNGSHLRDRGMIGFTELLRHAQGCLAVLAK